jgi:hypothetical protein
MKTVLAPNAPWPVVKREPVAVKKPRAKRPSVAKPSQVDANFAAWLKRQGINKEIIQ